MPVLSDYVSGTLSVTNGSVNFTGTATGWLLAGFKEGDTIIDITGATEYWGVIATIDANGAGTLTKAWEGPTLVDVAYRMRYQPDGARVSAQARNLIEILGNGNLQALAGLSGSANQLPMFTGPGAMTLIPKTDLVSGADYDVQVDQLADRAAYDSQVAGFSVLVSNVGDGRAAIYSKVTATVGDWSDAAYVTGPVGPASTVPGITWKGTYSGATAYVLNDGALYNGSSWRALQATTGNTPPTLPTESNAYWELLARQGIDGAGTVNSVVAGDGIRVDSSDPTAPIVSADPAMGLIGGRLSLVSGDPLPEADVVGATNVYLVPALNNVTSLYDGTNWVLFSFAQITLSLVASHLVNNNYDVWEFDDGGALNIGTGPSWLDGAVAGSATARGTGAGSTELELFQGRIVNKVAMTLRNGATTYAVGARECRLRGALRMTANGQTEDSKAKRLVSNVYNPDLRTMLKIDSTTTWAYSTATWRQARAAADNQIEFLHAVAGRAVKADVNCNAYNSTATARNVAVGIGVDTATINSAQRRSGAVLKDLIEPLNCWYNGYPGLGYHSLKWLEIGAGADTQTWVGIFSGSFEYFQSGIAGESLF